MIVAFAISGFSNLQRVPRRSRSVYASVHLRAYRARPEEALQTVAPGAWDDVDVQVGDALAHGVVVGHERALRTDASGITAAIRCTRSKYGPTSSSSASVSTCATARPAWPGNSGERSRNATATSSGDDLDGGDAGDDSTEHASSTARTSCGLAIHHDTRPALQQDVVGSLRSQEPGNAKEPR